MATISAAHAEAMTKAADQSGDEGKGQAAEQSVHLQAQVEQDRLTDAAAFDDHFDPPPTAHGEWGGGVIFAVGNEFHAGFVGRHWHGWHGQVQTDFGIVQQGSR